MRAAERNYWDEYLRDAADTMGLRDWTFFFHYNSKLDDNDEDTLARIVITRGRKVAHIHYDPNFFTKTPFMQRWAIAHEFVHCHFDDAWKQAGTDLETLIGKPADSVFWPSFERNMEHGIDACADVMAKLLPLPHVPTPKKKTTRKRTR